MENKRNITTVGGLQRYSTLQSNLLNTDIRLSHCPFCGAEAGFRGQRINTPQPSYIRVECSNTSCGVSIPYHYMTEGLAIQASNRQV